MAIASGETIPTPNGETPFAAVIWHDSKEIARFPVKSMADGDSLIGEVLRKLKEFAVADGDIGTEGA